MVLPQVDSATLDTVRARFSMRLVYERAGELLHPPLYS